MKHPRILFLDIDGVLNSQRHFETCEAERKRLFETLGYRAERDHAAMIDKEAVALLNEILERSGARVCVSSSWRKLFTIPDLQTILRSRGFRGQLIGRTPDIWRLPEVQALYGRRCRGHEIQIWLDRHARYGIERFAIVDDDSDMAHLVPKLVQTTAERGLERDHVERAIALLT